MQKQIVVYRMEGEGNDCKNGGNQLTKLEIWRPGIFRFLPPHKDIKYLIYWFFHMLRIFKNRHYSAYFYYEEENLVSSCLVVPSYFKWSFMGARDVQFTYVMTNQLYRGQGVASKLIYTAMSDLGDKVGSFWYVTDTENPASMRVAEKMGFVCMGEADRSSTFKILNLKTAD